MEHGTYKILDNLGHIWPIIAGLFATILGGIRLWRSARKKLYTRIANIEIIAERAVTQETLAACRADVANEDVAILEEIKEIRRDMRNDNKVNALAHNALMENASKQQQELMHAILQFHVDK